MLPLMTVILIVLGISGMQGVEGKPVQGNEFEKILEHIVRISASIGTKVIQSSEYSCNYIDIFSLISVNIWWKNSPQKNVWKLAEEF